ncbi:hypothetical protein MTO96_041624 [Rhipicephalus appendiculatus]
MCPQFSHPYTTRNGHRLILKQHKGGYGTAHWGPIPCYRLLYKILLKLPEQCKIKLLVCAPVVHFKENPKLPGEMPPVVISIGHHQVSSVPIQDIKARSIRLHGPCCHRYLGPGNPLRNGDPVDEDDGIAKSHDEASGGPKVTWTSLRLTRHLRLSS